MSTVAGETLLGLELPVALERLRQAGVCDVSVVETRSRKGVDKPDSTRVLRVKRVGGIFELITASCRCSPLVP